MVKLLKNLLTKLILISSAALIRAAFLPDGMKFETVTASILPTNFPKFQEWLAEYDVAGRVLHALKLVPSVSVRNHVSELVSYLEQEGFVKYEELKLWHENLRHEVSEAACMDSSGPREKLFLVYYAKDAVQIRLHFEGSALLLTLGVASAGQLDFNVATGFRWNDPNDTWFRGGTQCPLFMPVT